MVTVRCYNHMTNHGFHHLTLYRITKGVDLGTADLWGDLISCLLSTLTSKTCDPVCVYVCVCACVCVYVCMCVCALQCVPFVYNVMLSSTKQLVLLEIMSNVHLNTNFLNLAREVRSPHPTVCKQLVNY